MKTGTILRNVGLASLMTMQAVVPCFVWGQAGQAPAAQQAAVPGAIGLLNTASGAVYMRIGDGPEVLMKPGDLFVPGASIRTDAESGASLVFADGQIINLAGSSSVRIDDYRFSTSDPKGGRASISVLGGVMNFVTGAIVTGNPDALRITAGDSSIGVKGNGVSAFVVSYEEPARSLGFVAVSVGGVSVRGPSGTLDLAADQVTRVQPGRTLSTPLPLSAAPAGIQGQVAALQANVLTETRPVDVQAAALQAALAALPATAAGQGQQPQVQVSEVVIPAVTPGGGGGCTGSPC